MPLKADPIRGEVVAARGFEFSGTLSPGKKPLNHQGNDNLLLSPDLCGAASARGAIRCRERLGGLLKYYSRAA
jgi:hypothetical protein